MFKNIYLFYKNDTPFTKVTYLYKYKYYILIKSKKFLEVKDSLEQNIFIKNDRCNDNIYGCLYSLR